MKAVVRVERAVIESLFKELLPLPKNETGERDEIADSPAPDDSENSFLAALTVVQKIVRRKVAFSDHAESSDMVQGIALRLWKWREKFREKSEAMSPDEWQSFAARAAYNEINRHFSGKFTQLVPLDEALEVVESKSATGESEVEIGSLVQFIWQDICRMTVRQRRALLLHSQQLIVYFLWSGINDKKLAAALDLTDEKWMKVKIEMPLSDARIAELSDDKNRTSEPNVRSIKKARHEARAKLRAFINEGANK